MIAFSGNFKTAIASLKASRGRSLLTMTGIIIGISSVITIISFGNGLRNKIDGQVRQLGDSVITVRSGQLAGSQSARVSFLAFLNTSTLTPDDSAAIAKLPNVDSVAPMSFVTNVVSSGNTNLSNVSVIGTSGALADMLRQKLDYGTFFDDTSVDQNFAVIGPFVANHLFGQPNPLVQPITIGAQTVRVTGVLSPSSGGLFSVAETDFNSTIFIPMPIAQSITGNRTNILQILVKPKAGVNPDTVVTQINSALVKLHGQQDFSVLKQTDLLNITGGIIDTLTHFITAIAAIALLVGGIGIMDIMLVSVSERTREIGVRKAIGATNSQILNQFLVEGLVLSVTGGIIGIVVSFIIDVLLRFYSGLQPAVTAWTVVLGAGVSIAMGVLFSTAPAFKAARKHPIDALRHE